MEQTSSTEARFGTVAYLKLRAYSYPVGEFYDRPYWKVELVCGAFNPPTDRYNSWTHSLGMAPAGSERGEPFLHKLKGPCEADVWIGEDTIALYLYWNDESLVLSHGGTVKEYGAGRELFDAETQAGGQSARLAIDFIRSEKRISSSHSGFTTGQSLVTGVPGNLSATRPTSQPAD